MSERKANAKRLQGKGLANARPVLGDALLCLSLHPQIVGAKGKRIVYAQARVPGDVLGERKANALQVTLELELVMAKGMRRTGRRERESPGPNGRRGIPLS